MEKEALRFKDIIDKVREFHDAFGIDNAHKITADPKTTEYELRHRLMREESEEYLEAAAEGDLKEVADACGDMLYILCGTILKHGLEDKIEDLFLEIHRSNMSKLDENGKAIYREDGKVMKSDRYFKPDIIKVLED